MATTIKRTVISFAPLHSLLRERKIADLQLAQRIGEKVAVVRNIQLNSHTTTVEVLRKICEELQCQPGDIMEAIQVEIIPANPPK